MCFIIQLLNIGWLQYTALAVISSSITVGKAIHLSNRFPLRKKRSRVHCVKFASVFIFEKKKEEEMLLVFLPPPPPLTLKVSIIIYMTDFDNNFNLDAQCYVTSKGQFSVSLVFYRVKHSFWYSMNVHFNCVECNCYSFPHTCTLTTWNVIAYENICVFQGVGGGGGEITDKLVNV